MQCNQVIKALAAHAHKPHEALSVELGRARSWVSVVGAARRSPALATVAEVADACGIDVVLVDRATGERVGVVDAPRRAGKAQTSDEGGARH